MGPLPGLHSDVVVPLVGFELALNGTVASGFPVAADTGHCVPAAQAST